jgi:hypothetical protein
LQRDQQIGARAGWVTSQNHQLRQVQQAGHGRAEFVNGLGKNCGGQARRPSLAA